MVQEVLLARVGTGKVVLFPENSNSRKLLLPLVLTAQEELVSWKASEIQELVMGVVGGKDGHGHCQKISLSGIREWAEIPQLLSLLISDLSVAPLGLVSNQKCASEGALGNASRGVKSQLIEQGREGRRINPKWS